MFRLIFCFLLSVMLAAPAHASCDLEEALENLEVHLHNSKTDLELDDYTALSIETINPSCAFEAHVSIRAYRSKKDCRTNNDHRCIHVWDDNVPLEANISRKSPIPTFRIDNDAASIGTWHVEVNFTLPPQENEAPKTRQFLLPFEVAGPSHVSFTVDAGKIIAPIRAHLGVTAWQPLNDARKEWIKQLKINHVRTAFRWMATNNHEPCKENDYCWWGQKFTLEQADSDFVVTSGDLLWGKYDEPIPKNEQEWLAKQQEWTEYLKARPLLEGMRLNYFEVINEPNHFWEGTREEFFQLIKHIHLAVKNAYPDKSIPVVFPSNSGDIVSTVGDGPKFWEQLFDFVEENQIEPFAISWHEFNSAAGPELIPRNVKIMRDYMKHRGLCNPNCPEIHINEFGSAVSSLVPSVHLGYFMHLEQAMVEQATRSCWMVRGRTPKDNYQSCYNTGGGLFNKDVTGVHPIYWLWHAYAQMKHDQRLETTSSKLRAPILASLGKDNIVRILVGRYTCGKNKQWCEPDYPFCDRYPGAKDPGTSYCTVFDDPAPPTQASLTITNLPYGTATQARVCYWDIDGSDQIKTMRPEDIPTGHTDITISAGGKIDIPTIPLPDTSVRFMKVKPCTEAGCGKCI